jgi:hypothetical protein
LDDSFRIGAASKDKADTPKLCSSLSKRRAGHSAAFSRRTTCRPGCLARSFSCEFKVSSVSGSAQQLTLDNVNCMGDLMVIHRMEIRKAKKLTGNRSRKDPTFRFLLGKPKRHHALSLSRGRLSFNFCARGKLSFGISLCIGQMFTSLMEVPPRVACLGTCHPWRHLAFG